MSNKVLNNLSRMRKGIRKGTRKGTRKGIRKGARKMIMKVKELTKRMSKMVSKTVSTLMTKSKRHTKSKRMSKRHTKSKRKSKRHTRRAMRGGDYETSITSDEVELIPTLKEDSKDLSVSIPGFGTVGMKAYHQYMEDLDRRGPRQM